MHIINPYRFGVAEFDPTDISGMKLWLDSVDTSTLWQDSARTTPVSSADDPVGAWDDKSGQGNNWVQATSGDRPLYKTDFNTSYPSVYFDGTGGKGLDGSMSEPAGDWTFFVVASRDSTGNDYVIDFLTGRFIIGNDASNGFGYYDGAWHRGSNLATSTPSVIVVKANSSGTSGSVIVNGSTLFTETYTQKALGGTQQIGARYNSISLLEWDGRIASILIYSGNLSAGNIASVETYLKSRYGVSY